MVLSAWIMIFIGIQICLVNMVSVLDFMDDSTVIMCNITNYILSLTIIAVHCTVCLWIFWFCILPSVFHFYRFSDHSLQPGQEVLLMWWLYSALWKYFFFYYCTLALPISLILFSKNHHHNKSYIGIFVLSCKNTCSKLRQPSCFH